MPDILSQTFRAEPPRLGRLIPGSFIVRSPGRVNLIGEHTDYNEGLVMPMAIEPHLRIEVVPRNDQQIRLESAGHGEAVWIDPDRHLNADHFRGKWSAYPCGVLAGFQRLGWKLPAFEARISATLPPGSGLSSSAALEVGTATVIETLCGRSLSLEQKALLCQRAEHEFAGVPCGIMDPFAVTFAQAGNALLLDCRTRQMRHVPLDFAAVSVLVVHSGVKHHLADGEYALRRQQCEAAARRLGVPSLRDALEKTTQQQRNGLPALEAKRARHVISEHERTLKFVRALETADWAAAGAMMRASHASLRDDFDVSCHELDLLVELSERIPGIHGCRMTGGGFGGCVVALTDTSRAKEIGREWSQKYQAVTGMDPMWFLTKAAAGASVVV